MVSTQCMRAACGVSSELDGAAARTTQLLPPVFRANSQLLKEVLSAARVCCETSRREHTVGCVATCMQAMHAPCSRLCRLAILLLLCHQVASQSSSEYWQTRPTAEEDLTAEGDDPTTADFHSLFILFDDDLIHYLVIA